MQKTLLRTINKLNLTPQKLLIILALIVFVPLIVSSFFDHPSVDDFCFSAVARDSGFIGGQMQYYLTWTGRYASTATIMLATNFPGWMSTYKFIPIALFLLTFGVIFLLFKTIFAALYETKKATTLTCINLSLITTILLVISMPSLTEGFYWASGALTYQTSFILLVLNFSLTIALLKGSTIIKILATIALMILNALLIGMNEVAMLVALLMNALMLVHAIHQRKNRWAFLLIFLISIIAAYIVIKAPGNTVRSTHLPDKMGIFSAMFFGFALALKTIFDVIKTTNFWLLVIAYIIFLPKDFAEKVRLKSIKKWWIWGVALLSLLIVCMGTTAPLWAGGYLPPRTVDLLTELWIIGCFVILTLLFLSKSQWFKWIEKIKTTPAFTFSLFSFLILATVFGSTSGLGYFDLLSGTATKYNQQLLARYQQIAEAQKSPNTTVETSALQTFPKLLYFDDIKNDENDWRNVCYAEYFKIDKIRTK